MALSNLLISLVVLSHCRSYEDDDFVVNDNQVVRDMRVEIEHKMSERFVHSPLSLVSHMTWKKGLHSERT